MTILGTLNFNISAATLIINYNSYTEELRNYFIFKREFVAMYRQVCNSFLQRTCGLSALRRG